MAQTPKKARTDSVSYTASDQSINRATNSAAVNGQGKDEIVHKTRILATILLVKEGIQEKRFGLIQNFARNNGFICENQLSERVSHVVTDLEDLDQLCRLHPTLPAYPLTSVVTSHWLYASVRAKSLIPTSTYLVPGYEVWRARVKAAQLSPLRTTSTTLVDTSPSLMKNYHSHIHQTSLEESAFDKNFFNKNPLERNAPLSHCNPKLVEPLNFLSDYWLTLGDEQRSLAYATAAATLKCLPFTATTMAQIEELKGVGSGHCLKVLQEILDTGACQEVTTKRLCKKYKRIKNLTGVYGIGSSLAEKLHMTHNVACVADIITQWEHINLHDERIKYGVAYYEDLNTPVTREMVERIQMIVKKELDSIREGYRLELTGGFRRGKSTGHDVDFLIGFDEDESTAEGSRAREDSPLTKLLFRLCQRGLILQARLDRRAPQQEDFTYRCSSFEDQLRKTLVTAIHHLIFKCCGDTATVDFKKQSDKVNTVDNFEKCFCIMKCPLSDDWVRDSTPDIIQETSADFSSLVSSGLMKDRGWRATRVDLVLVPHLQWPYAVLGWTGSKLFLRLLRRYASATLGLTLTSHGLWSKAHGCLLPADTEEDIFRHLGLAFKHPIHRNF